MSKDFGSQGTSAPFPTTDPLEGPVPHTGFDESPKGEKITFHTGPGVGGSNPGFKG